MTFNLVKIRLTIVTITTANLVRSSNNNVLGRQEAQNLLQNGKSYEKKHFEKWTRFIRTDQLIIGILTGKSVNSGKNRPRLIQIDLAVARSIFHNLGRFFPELTDLPVNIPIIN